MKLYRTKDGIVIEFKGQFYLHKKDWDTLINNDALFHDLVKLLPSLEPKIDNKKLIKNKVLPPIAGQELWASGVTYYKSRSARMEESKESGGGDFYDKVYYAERPELFFKCNGYRVKGPGEEVRIRKDSNWNVPEPELTLVITSSGKIIGYTIGNDMSSRSIEGENPLYLPQAKSYNGSAGLGPCILLSEKALAKETTISLVIERAGSIVFQSQTSLEEMKRNPEELVSYLFRELEFPSGCYLMTGTGVIPPDDFTLSSGDIISIEIDSIGRLENVVA